MNDRRARHIAKQRGVLVGMAPEQQPAFTRVVFDQPMRQHRPGGIGYRCSA